MSIYDYLASQSSPAWMLDLGPDWNLQAESVLTSFFSSRVVFYPASGEQDFQDILLFGLSGQAHCFVRADFGIPESSIPGVIGDLIDSLEVEVNGACYKQLGETLFIDRRWVETLITEPSPHLAPVVTSPTWTSEIPPYAALAIFESSFQSAYPSRFAVLFLGLEAVTGYAKLFCREGQRAPWAVLSTWGMQVPTDGGSDLANLAALSGSLPRWLLLETSDYEVGRPWEGYEFFGIADGGGVTRNFPRSLCRRRLTL